jgi:Replication protein A interacting C-terminal
MTIDDGQGRVLPVGTPSSYSPSKVTPLSAEASNVRRRKHSQQRWRRREVVRSLIHRELAARRRGRDGEDGSDGTDGRGGGYADDEDDDDHMEGVDVVAPMRMIFADNDDIGTTTVAATQRPQEPVTTSTWHDLSEEELLAFLEELERYDNDDDGRLELVEDHRLAAILQEEQMELENDYWADQYEQWQRQKGQPEQQQQPDDEPPDEQMVVPCPVCHRGQLRQEEGSAVIYCRGGAERSMEDDDSCCSFRLYSHLNLSELADRLHVVHQNHARRGFCRQLPRIVQMNNNNNNNHHLAATTTTTLTAFCVSCGYQGTVL